MLRHFFKHPEPTRSKTRIWPVFMPFAGCKVRCVYCSQERQTGTETKSLNEIYQDIEKNIPLFFSDCSRKPMELAFFGGTFTALPFDWQKRFITLAAQFKQKGWITAVRFSTRPDCIDSTGLLQLKEAGLDLVELGIQSFNTATLRRSARNYTPETAVAACRMVKETGLGLVIQLLPGLPGSDKSDFAHDVHETIKAGPGAVRIYPCLTLKGTILEKLYRAGKYTPWSLEQTEEGLASALLRFWEAGIQVIRMGIAQEEGFEDNIVAGPFHPALGQSARSRALYMYLSSKSVDYDYKRAHLYVPARYSGEFWGHKGRLKKDYLKIGLNSRNVSFHDTDRFLIEL